MKNLKKSTEIILTELAKRYPDQTQFRKNVIVEVGESFGYSGKDWDPIMTKQNRVKIGTYDLAGLIEPLREVAIANNVVQMPQAAAQMQSIVNEEKTYATVDKTFVPWGAFSDIVKIVKSNFDLRYCNITALHMHFKTKRPTSTFHSQGLSPLSRVCYTLRGE